MHVAGRFDRLESCRRRRLEKSCRGQRLCHTLQQLPGLRIAKSRDHRYIPQPRIFELPTSYGILLGHEHGKIVTKCQLSSGERMMIRKRMLNDVDPPGAQIAEET